MTITERREQRMRRNHSTRVVLTRLLPIGLAIMVALGSTNWWA